MRKAHGEHMLSDVSPTADIEFAESGEIYRSYPKAVGKSIIIRVFAKFPMNIEAAAFFDRVRAVVKKYGYELEFENPNE
jgi:hypothetical protein